MSLTDEIPTDAVVFTSRLQPARADALVERLFGARRARPPNFLLAAMEADAFVRTRPREYERVREMLPDS
jgi:hypothetical protein